MHTGSLRATEGIGGALSCWVRASGSGGRLPSLLPSWNSPGAAGRAQNLKPKRLWLAQARPIRWWWGEGECLYTWAAPCTPMGASCCSQGRSGPQGTPYTPLLVETCIFTNLGAFQSSLWEALWGSQKGMCSQPSPPSQQCLRKCTDARLKCMLCKDPRSTPSEYAQSFARRGVESIPWERDGLFNKWGGTGHSEAKT